MLLDVKIVLYWLSAQSDAQALIRAGYLMPEEPQGDDEEEDEEDEMDEDFTPEMADRLRGMITMGMSHVPGFRFGGPRADV